MAFLFRWLMRAFLAMAALAAAGAGLAYYLAGQSLPDYDRTLTLEGPAAAIEILRDRNAVPHILATEDADAFFGLGFVHAQDRLWQMTLLRRTAQGRLSELFGPETLEIDALMRALDLYGLARRSVEAQSEATRVALDAYADGVNAWLKVVQAEALGRGAPEFFLFDAHDRALDPGGFDRGAEADGAAADRQGRARDAARPAVAAACRPSGCATSCPTRRTRR